MFLPDLVSSDDDAYDLKEIISCRFARKTAMRLGNPRRQSVRFICGSTTVVRRRMAIAAVCLVVLAGGARRSLAADTRPAIKNVLFIVSDDLKASVLGCYGDKVCHTPNIDRLASEGVVFERTYCQGVVCGPSRTSFMHSRYKGDADMNLGRHFRENGRYSARVGKIYHMRVPGDIIAGTNGLDVESSWTERFNSQGQEAHTPGHYACLNQNIFTTDPENRQSTRMPHRMFVTVRYEGDGSDQPDHKSATKAIELLQKHQAEKFFLAVGLVRPHYPMVAPQQHFDPYPWQKILMPTAVENDLFDIPKAGLAATQSEKNPIGKYPDNQKRMWTGYYASVAFMDEQVGRIINELERLGLRDSTAIVFASDHGYHLGEHGFWQKSNLHEEVTRVPLIMSVPGFKPGRSQALTELMDIFPTLSDLAELKLPSTVQGKSLVPILEDNDASVRDGSLSLNGRGYSIRTSNWAFMRYGDKSAELYDMQADPNQFTNLVDDPDFANVREQLSAELDSRLKAAGLDNSSSSRKKR
jgi:iduronate 2-sulfatase